MKGKHVSYTPGPWLQSSSFLVCDQEARVIANCIPMLDVPQLAIPIPQAAPNARLIATAPDLLEALEAAYLRLLTIGDYPGRHTADGQCELVAIREAIAKAKGVDSQEVQDTAESIGLQLRLGKR